MTRMQELIFLGVCILIGEQGVDWQYYVHESTYWRKWVQLNRN